MIALRGVKSVKAERQKERTVRAKKGGRGRGAGAGAGLRDPQPHHVVDRNSLGESSESDRVSLDITRRRRARGGILVIAPGGCRRGYSGEV